MPLVACTNNPNSPFYKPHKRMGKCKMMINAIRLAEEAAPLCQDCQSEIPAAYGKAEKEKKPKKVSKTKTKKYVSRLDDTIWFKSTHHEKDVNLNYGFLSNFFPFVKPTVLALTQKNLERFTLPEEKLDKKTEGGFFYREKWCKSVEHGYQAKYWDVHPKARDLILSQTTALDAKKMNTKLKKKFPIDWAKFQANQSDIMQQILRAKFQQNPRLKRALLSTSTAHLAEVPGREGDKGGWAGAAGSGGGLLMLVRTEVSG